ncbi:response regulator [uncultured Brevundimonas sp.]|uniref:response regulator transcription factor n=1 Tax=uncultured Brevundimonas sp. TaxID=213418 RepID=UPI0030EC8565|tara:strand:+ start:33766 stop:34398 length:633 start_codon:yes stop_codon:yes gene_type:complete
MMPSVFVIDDDDAVRDSLTVLFRGESLQVRGFANGADFFDRLPDDAMACVVTDLRMPGIDGSELIRRVMALRGAAWPVVVVTGHADVPVAVRLMKAGVVDFIEKPVDPVQLVATVKACLRRLLDVDAERQSRAATLERLDRLTRRESQVFDGLIRGQSNKEIAQDLAISPRTVEVFRAKIMVKTEADSLSALVRMGLQVEAEAGERRLGT